MGIMTLYFFLLQVVFLVALSSACPNSEQNDEQHQHRHLLRQNTNDHVPESRIVRWPPPSFEDYFKKGGRCKQTGPTGEEIERASKLTQDWVQRKRLENRESGRDSAPQNATVPTYFHIITKDSGASWATEAIDAQLAILNERFSVVGFQFVLMGTPTVTNNASWYYQTSALDEYDMKVALRQGGPEALNVYVINPLDEFGENAYLGVATFPWDLTDLQHYDGVMLYEETMPTGWAWPYDEGITLVHEVGHWLGLYHTFQEEGTCGGIGDAIADTPAEFDATYGCPAERDSCPFDEGLDPVRNYMNYADDVCMEEFTPLQIERMKAMWDIFRTPKDPVPANNDCVDAIPITFDSSTAVITNDITVNVAVVNGTTLGANIPTDVPSCYGNELRGGVWYKMEFPPGAEVTIVSCDQIDYRLSISVYIGDGSCNFSSCEGGITVANGCSQYSLDRKIKNLSGFTQNYYFHVHGQYGERGNFGFYVTLTERKIADNDLCENAEVINMNGTNSLKISGNTDAALAETGSSAPACDRVSSQLGIWYSLQAPGNTRISLSTCGQTTYDNAISIYTGSCANLNCVRAGDQTIGCPGSSVELTFENTLDEEITYYILMHGYEDNTGDFNMTVTLITQNQSPTTAPTSVPTSAPTLSPRARSPTISPTRSPNALLSTVTPTTNPTIPPTTKQTVAPTTKPTTIASITASPSTISPGTSQACNSGQLACRGFLGLQGTSVYRISGSSQCKQRCTRVPRLLGFLGFECGICAQ